MRGGDRNRMSIHVRSSETSEDVLILLKLFLHEFFILLISWSFPLLINGRVKNSFLVTRRDKV